MSWIKWGEVETAEMDVNDLVYLFPFLAIAIVYPLDDLFPKTDVDSARYMLSALVQSEAAIIAVVVTLSLVAVQLTASSYSGRAIEVFKNAPYLWMLLSFYIVVMAYSLWILKLLNATQGNPTANAKLYADIILSYFFGIVAFIALIPYVWKILELLDPYVIINKLSKNITGYNVLLSKRLGDKKDPFQPVVDIAIGSLMKYDEGTLADALEAIGSKKESLFYENRRYENQIAELLFKHLTALGNLASERSDPYAASLIISHSAQIGVYVAGKGLGDAAAQAVESISNVGTKAVEMGLEDPATLAAKFFGEVGIKAVEMGLEDPALLAVESLGRVGTKAAETRLEYPALLAAESLGEVGTKAVEMGLEDPALLAVEFLREVGTKTAEMRLEYPAIRAVESLRRVGTKAAEMRLEYPAIRAVESLGEVGTKAAEMRLEDPATKAVESLDKVGTKATEMRLGGPAAAQAAESLDKVGTKATEMRLEGLAKISFAKAKKLGYVEREF